jgi:hypothetical protein
MMSFVRACGLACIAFEQLRCAADAGERILDLMCQHRGSAGGGACAEGGTAHSKRLRLPMDMQRDDPPALVIKQRMDQDIHLDRLVTAGMYPDIIGRERLVGHPDCRVHAWIVDAQDATDGTGDQCRASHVQQRFRARIGADDPPVRVDQQRGHRMSRDQLGSSGNTPLAGENRA